MKWFLLSIITCVLAACNSGAPVKVFYGEKFTETQPISADSLIKAIDGQAAVKGIQVSGTVDKSCTHKGCWLTLENVTGEKIMVTYKDDAFTTAKDIKGRKVTLIGDGNKNADKDQYEFIATGVILN